MSATVPPHDAAFEKYARMGAYHWREISRHPTHHQAFTAERYRRTLDALAPLQRQKILDYGCGDGALLGLLARAVGPEGEAHGLDVNAEAVDLARFMLSRNRLEAPLYSSPSELPADYFDGVICAEVIEHVLDLPALLADIHRCLRPGGRAVITTPVRMTEVPEDPNHVREWFPSEFEGLFEDSPLSLLRTQQIIPAAAPEVYFWRPPFFFRIPVFRLLCNLLSITFHVNALSWLRLRPRLFMTQMALLEKPPT